MVVHQVFHLDSGREERKKREVQGHKTERRNNGERSENEPFAFETLFSYI